MPDALDDLPQPSFEGTTATDALETDGDNPNEMTDEQFGLLKERMRQNGWLGGPIVTDTDGLIADGEHRWRAADAIGLDEVPVRQYDIDDATRRLWRQELNKIHGEHDTKRDALEYDYLLDAGKADEVHELTKAADEDLDELLAEIKMETSASPAYEYDPDHNVYFEDCVEGMRERLDNDSVDCVITDPPYGIEWDSPFSDRFDEIENDDNMEWVRPFFSEISRVLKPGRHAYIFTGWTPWGEIYTAAEEHGFEKIHQLIWKKSRSRSSGGSGSFRTHHENIMFAKTKADSTRLISDSANAWTVIDDDGLAVADDMDHPNQKPVSLIKKLLDWSTNKEETVLDPFMGSGTTAVAAVQNDREYVGFEVDAENYRDVIERRIGEAKRQRDAEVNADA